MEDVPSDSDTYYSQSRSKQMKYSPTPKINTVRKQSNLTARDDSDSDSSTLSSSSYFTPLPPDEDNEEKKSETIKQFPKAPPLQTTVASPITPDSGTLNQMSEHVQILSPVQPKVPKLKTQSEPPLLAQSLTQSAKEQSPQVKGTQSLKYHIIPKAKSVPTDQISVEYLKQTQANDTNSDIKDNAEEKISNVANDNDIKSDKIPNQITEEPNSTETKSDNDATLDNKKQDDTTSTEKSEIEKQSNGHNHDTEIKDNQKSCIAPAPKKKVAFVEDIPNSNGYAKEPLESISENAQLPQQAPPAKIDSNAAELPMSNDSQPLSPKITITESTDSVQKPISSSMNEFKRRTKSNTGRKARKSRKSSAQREKKIRKKSRAAKGTIPPPNIPDMVIEEDDGTTYLPVRMVHLFARVRTHHKLNNYRNMNYASKSYQQDPKLVNTVLDQQNGMSGECKIGNGVYAFAKNNIGTQKEYKLALRANSDDIHHATAMLNFVQSKLDESLEKVKKITKFNHDICIQSIIAEMNKR